MKLLIAALIEIALLPFLLDRVRGTIFSICKFLWHSKDVRKFLASALAQGKAIRAERAMFFGGIAFVGIGAGIFNLSAGLVITGVLMLLSLKSLWGWLK